MDAVITRSFFSLIQGAVITIKGSSALTVNYSVFDQINTGAGAIISYSSYALTAEGVCAYKCKSYNGTVVCYSFGESNFSFLSVAYCSPEDASGADVLNFWNGPVQLTQNNISYGKVNEASGFQIMGVDQNSITVKNVICVESVGNIVIEYNDINSNAIFDYLVICKNECFLGALYYSIQNPKSIFFTNCFFEAPKGDKPFIIQSRDSISFYFENTYFSGKNFGISNLATSGFITTSELSTPIILAGYQTYLCEGVLTDSLSRMKSSKLSTYMNICIHALFSLCQSGNLNSHHIRVNNNSK